MGDDYDDDHSLHLFCKQKVSFGKLRKLRLFRIPSCNKVFCCSEMSVDSFTHLEDLTLISLPKLKTFCDSALGFPKLLKLCIIECPELGGFNMGSLTTPNLQNLESVYLSGCRMMEQVFLWSEEQSHPKPRHLTLPKLTTLDLTGLPELRNICKGFESFEFPLLTRMHILSCRNLKSLVSDIHNKVVGKTVKEQTTVYYNSSSLFPTRSFTTLESLNICTYDEISSLFSSSVARNLNNLKVIAIQHCKNMVRVIEDEVEEYSHDQTTLLFPHLEKLYLFVLPKLEKFCEWRCALELPSLKEMSILSGCPKLERFSMGSLTTPNLKTIGIDNDYITITGDLNHVLCQNFITREKSTPSEGQEGPKEEASTSSKENVSQEDNEKERGKKVEKEEEATLIDRQEVKEEKDEIEEVYV